ncbi:MAG: 5-(carboxyamino)imidazole ribonucleotide synthase [Planctomycetota bacterium]
MNRPILPGSVLGVLGGGQLGRMFTLAARRMGYRIVVLAPEDDTPAGQIAYREIRAPYDDLDAVERFAADVDVVTFEFENVPAATIDAAARHAPVRPAGSVLATTQDRAVEKHALALRGIPVVTHAVVESATDLDAALRKVGTEGVLKTSAWGYDGHGQRRVGAERDLAAAFDELGRVPCVFERFVPFACEISVVGVRGVDGEVALYEPFLNHHADHVLDVSICPAPLATRVRDDALAIARRVLEELDVVGVLCVEFFLLEDGGLLVNELAPRPHNSGHATIDAHHVCQFEQQVRAVCGLPLGSTRRKVPAAAMANLLGDLWSDGEPDWAALLADPDAKLHLYGKVDARPGRKMGHVTIAADDPAQAERRVRSARAALVRRTAAATRNGDR